MGKLYRITRTKYVEVKVPVQESVQAMCCRMGGDAESALSMWRAITVNVAKRSVRLIPNSRAAHALLQAARKGELPLWSNLGDRFSPPQGVNHVD